MINVVAGRPPNAEQQKRLDDFVGRLRLAVHLRGGKGRGSDAAVTRLDDATGQSRGTTTRLLGGLRKRLPDVDAVHAYARELGVSYRWLATGEGEMLAENALSPLEADLRASVDRDNLEDAIRYERPPFPDAIVMRVRLRAKAEGIDICSRTPEEWTRILRTEMRREWEEFHALRTAERAAEEAPGKKRNVGT